MPGGPRVPGRMRLIATVRPSRHKDLARKDIGKKLGIHIVFRALLPEVVWVPYAPPKTELLFGVPS